MTAVNGFIIEGAAYLSADAAVWGPDGSLTEHRQKLVAVPEALTVFAARGVFAHGLLELMGRSCRTLAEVHAMCAHFARTNAGRVGEEDEWEGWHDRAVVEFMGASWNEGDPCLWTISQDENGDLEPRGYKGLRVSPNVDWNAALGRSIATREDVDALDPRAAAAALMQAQRLAAHDTAAGPLHCVGGWCDLATVTGSSVTIETLHHWHDPLGRKITP